MNNGEVKTRYIIDLDWYQQAGRSFPVLAQSRLCSSCQKRQTPVPGRAITDLFQVIKDCCSKKEGFISPNLPLLEMIFRLFLANGDQPLELEQIQEQLKEWLGTFRDSRDLSIRVLERLIDNDDCYGLRPLPSTDEGEP